MQGKSAHSTESSASFTLFDYLHILRKRKNVVIATIVLCLLGALFINVTQKPLYQSSVEVVLESKSADNSAQTSSNALSQDPTFMLTQVRMIKSPILAERAAKKLEALLPLKSLLLSFGIKPSPKASIEQERKALPGAIRNFIAAVQPERGVRIFSIGVRGYDPAVVKQATDAVAQSYVEINYESRINAFKQSFSVISKSLAEIREKIKTGDIAFKKIDSELQLLEALKIYGEKHPTVVSLSASIPALGTQLQLGMNNLQAMELGQRRDLLPLLLESHTDLPALTAIESDLRIVKPILEQEVSTNREMYNSIFKKLQEVELAGGKNAWLDANVLEPAGIPSRPVRPNKTMNITVALLLGFFLGASLAYFLEYLDSSLRSVDDVRNYLKIFPLGMVPFVSIDIPDQKRQARWKEQDGSRRLYWNTAEHSIPLYVAEAYRIIRTNLSFGSLDREIKILQVTSAVKGEGKTTTVANLGISLAQAGLKTLLVDADMRRPSLDCIFGLEGVEEGFSNALTHGVRWQDAVVPTSIPNLFCLSAGVIPPNPAELLTSKRVKTLIEEFRDQYDMVIFDCPPIISVADSPILASCVDATVLVARSGFIPRHFTLQAKNALENVNGRVIGCILNSVQEHNQPYYHRYYGYHSYYGKEASSSEIPKNSNKELSSGVERIKALRDPLMAFISSAGAQIFRWLKWEQPPQKNKFPDARD